MFKSNELNELNSSKSFFLTVTMSSEHENLSMSYRFR